MKKRSCKCCRYLFKPGLRHPNQKYCTKVKCQKARKAKWQKEKRANDELYRQKQRDCQTNWSEKNPGYWDTYRKNNPTYTERNRQKQRIRNRINRSFKSTKSISTPIAKMDVVNDENARISGRYQLIPISGKMVAKMDVVIVEINEITRG